MCRGAARSSDTYSFAIDLDSPFTHRERLSPETLQARRSNQDSPPLDYSPTLSVILGFHGDCDGKHTKLQSSVGRVLGSVLVDSCCDRVENYWTLA